MYFKVWAGWEVIWVFGLEGFGFVIIVYFLFAGCEDFVKFTL